MKFSQGDHLIHVRFRFHPPADHADPSEGYIFIAAFAVVALVLGWAWAPLGWIGLALTLWCAYFFRDPARLTPLDDRLVISPADGIVSSVVSSRRRRNWASAQILCRASPSSCRFSIVM